MSSQYRSPFRDLREALGASDRDADLSLEAELSGIGVRIDPNRTRRTGIPEIVHAEHKEPEAVAAALERLALEQGRALASRINSAAIDAVRSLIQGQIEIEIYTVARAIVAVRDGAEPPRTGGNVGVLSAGTSDVPIAAEASLIANEMGATVFEAWDVGVAGLHRLVSPLERFAAEEVDAIVVAAGMDGALPAVVAGLVDVPVIGLPTSIGYGMGAKGIGALTTMLQSCAPGLVVVNVDNGIGAGSTAALIANRAARLRGRLSQP